MKKSSFKPTRKIAVYLVVGIFLTSISYLLVRSTTANTVQFNGERAYEDLVYQVALGPRIPGSQAHSQTITYITDQLEVAGWESNVTSTTWEGYPIHNIIATNKGEAPAIIIGTHYDTRLASDRDNSTYSHLPVPGANDGASGVAVLLELARILPASSPQVVLAFFDGEDNGGIDGREWIMGSRSYVEDLINPPQAVVILDMIGDKDLNIQRVRNTNRDLTDEIWHLATSLGYEDYFLPIDGYEILDDHVPFLEAGIPATLIIDLDYPYWHTHQDTIDKVSAKSLEIVGETIRIWLEEY